MHNDTHKEYWVEHDNAEPMCSICTERPVHYLVCGMCGQVGDKWYVEDYGRYQIFTCITCSFGIRVNYDVVN